MDVSPFEVADFAASLSAIFVLALAYGAIHRQTAGRISPQGVLGALFGIVALIEMFRPIEPFDGVLIDMRIVPIALAGAFLGRVGLGVCVAIAVIGRLHLGGAGTLAGVAGMVLAGGMGFLWHRLTRHLSKRGATALFGLGVMISTSLSAGLFLPLPSMLWFFEHAALPLLGLYLAALPAAAYVLERERARILAEDKLKAAAHAHPENGLLTWPHFKRELGCLMTSATPGQISGLAVVRVTNRGWLNVLLGGDFGVLLGALRVRLLSLLPDAGVAGLLPDQRLVIPLSSQDMAQSQQIAGLIQNALEQESLSLPSGFASHARIAVSLHPAASHRDMARLLIALEHVDPAASTPNHRSRRGHVSDMNKPFVKEGQIDVLFDKADLLMSTRG